MLGHPALPASFWSKVEPQPGGCWHWIGARNSKGYGSYMVGGVSKLAHRVVYDVLVGSIPDGHTIDHLCRVKACVNPAHLEPVELRENIRRAYEQDRPSSCPRGHEYTEANTRVKQRSNGQINRTCRSCEAALRPIKNARARAVAAARKDPS